MRYWIECDLAQVNFFLYSSRKTTFKELVEELYGTTGKTRDGHRGPMFDPCERTAVFLWRLGRDATVRQTSVHFGLSEGTISKVTLEVARLVDDKLFPECIQWPTPRQQRTMAREWEAEKSLRCATPKMLGGTADGRKVFGSGISKRCTTLAQARPDGKPRVD